MARPPRLDAAEGPAALGLASTTGLPPALVSTVTVVALGPPDLLGALRSISLYRRISFSCSTIIVPREPISSSP